MTDDLPGFIGSRLDRADHLRGDRQALARLAAAEGARLLRLDGLEPVIAGDRLDWGHPSDAPAEAELALLGLIDDVPHFLAIVPPEPPARAPRIFGVIGDLAAGEAATYAAARSLVDWHQRHRFCANCGGSTLSFRAGWARRCDACDAEHFPRTDPVVIMLATHQGRVLIGRQPRYPAGRYSALAGFVEVGESIEEAVARELKEEAGVVATSVRYVASQPWPFASSLMIACIAEVEDDALTIDTTELDDAKWVTRAEVEAALAGDSHAAFLPPPPYAIAHTLFRRWLRDG